MPQPVVTVMGRGSAEAHRPAPGTVCISITAPGEPPADLHAGYSDILRLDFSDGGHLQEDVTQVAPGTSISAAQADAIAAFVARHAEAPVILVHCGMGVSRSVAVGHAIALALRCHLECAVRALHNRHVFVTVGRALRAHAVSPCSTPPAPAS